MMLSVILLVFAFVFAVVAALNVSIPHIHFGWLALAFLLLVLLLGGVHPLTALH